MLYSPIPDNLHFYTFLYNKKTPQPKQPSKTIQDLLQLLQKAFAIINQEWVHLKILGNALKKVDSTFKNKDYGNAKLSKLLKKLPEFVEVKENKAKLKTLEF